MARHVQEIKRNTNKSEHFVPIIIIIIIIIGAVQPFSTADTGLT